MDYRRFGDTYLLRPDIGEEIIECLLKLAENEGIDLASVQGIGGLSKARLGVYSMADKEYNASDYEGFFEIVSLLGSLDSMDGRPFCHLHAQIAEDTGRMFGGHLLSGTVGATAEIFVRRLEGKVTRRTDGKTGIRLLQLR